MEKKVIGLSELVPQAADAAGISKNKAEKFVKALKAAITNEIRGGNDVMITGLVAFNHRSAKEREINLRGESHIVPAHDMVKARASKKLYKK